MSRITNTILSPSIPNPQYKKYLNGHLTLTLIIPSHPSRCESWNDYPIFKTIASALRHIISLNWSNTTKTMIIKLQLPVEASYFTEIIVYIWVTTGL